MTTTTDIPSTPPPDSPLASILARYGIPPLHDRDDLARVVDALERLDATLARIARQLAANSTKLLAKLDRIEGRLKDIDTSVENIQ